jgi:hypothetical protein
MRARAEGKTLGRPRIAEKTERALRAALGKKDRPGIRRIAADFGVGVGTVQRIAETMVPFREASSPETEAPRLTE